MKAVLPLDRSVRKLTALDCRRSFWAFVQEFWEQIPGAGSPIWNWHIEYLCGELQYIAERVFRNEPKEHDLLVNVAPGTSKSSLFSILFPAWTWTRMPQARHILASHTDMLVLDLATKSRHVIESEKYREFFPEIKLRKDQKNKGYFANTLGGDRVSCTVGGKSPLGFHAQFLCLPWEVPVQSSVGMIPIGRLVDDNLDVRVLGYDHDRGASVWCDIESRGSSPGRPVCRVVFSNGFVLEATENHPVYVVGKGYVNAKDLVVGDEVIHAVPVRTLSEAGESFPVSRGAVGSEEGVLQPEVLCGLHEHGKPPSVQQGGGGVPELWQAADGKEGEGRRTVLQPRVSGAGDSGGEQSLVGGEEGGSLRALRQGHASVEGQASEVLQPRLCQPAALQKHDGGGEQQLPARGGVLSLFDGVHSVEEGRSPAGQVPLLFVRQDAGGEREAHGRPSHRLGQVQQRDRELGLFVHGVSSWSGEEQVRPAAAGSVFVVSVEVAVRIPEKVYNLEVKGTHNYFAGGILVHNCWDDPINPQKVLSELELRKASEFTYSTLMSRKVNKQVSVFYGVMQRLHELDPTGDMLERSAKHQEHGRIKHICLPAELTDGVKPPELKSRYKNGLMDPHRLDQRALAPYKIHAYSYAGQFLQEPMPLGGGMFKAGYFTQLVKAAPYNATRVRAWDKAATEGGTGARTCGTLLALAEDGNWYVENVVVGRWESDTRDDHILLVAQQDRRRYGPRHEPTIYIEQEPGSSGKDSFKSTARKLAGYRVIADRPTGKKEVRAGPWAAQCAAMNVYVVDDGTWDVNDWVKEHCNFPLGRTKDQVDSASLAFNKLVATQRTTPPLRVLTLGGSRRKMEQKVLVCDTRALSGLVIEDQHCLVVSVFDPLQEVTVPQHGIALFQGHLALSFADVQPSDYQASWTLPLEPYKKPPSEVCFNQDLGKKFWNFLLKRRDTPFDLLVFHDDGEKLGLSLAAGVCDVLRIPRNSAIFFPSAPDSTVEGRLVNQHVIDVVKHCRGLVMS